ncbi:hypothetical protein [Enhygromyxa salina]|uniref:Anti-sigma factor n=1 Tax=Enhygromyxa salina TaxID=215803 RepID=A0A2S9YNH3_9BACT|nr:hypothetical protein [Enhygromyxa salina]PRQ06634.1 hypothetical protein ENSA7_36550 [Enhygromyxa salina]
MSEATSNPDAAQIMHELATLGEPPPSAAELAHDSLDDDPEVASVARLAELAEPLEVRDLSELELHRAWRGVEQRLPGASASPAPEPSRGAKLPWLIIAVGVAAAAAVVLIVLPPGEDSQRRAKVQTEQVTELGDQARTALRVLDDGQTDTERATQLAATYQRRLEEQGG